MFNTGVGIMITGSADKTIRVWKTGTPGYKVLQRILRTGNRVQIVLLGKGIKAGTQGCKVLRSL